MKFRKAITVVAAGLILALLAFAILKPRQVPIKQSFSMAPGMTVTFEAVTHGATNEFIWGKSYRKTLRRILPAKLKTLSGCQDATFITTQTNSPVFWFTCDPGQMGKLVTRMIDEYGNEYNPMGYSMRNQFIASDKHPGQVQLFAYQMGNYGPAGKIVGMSFFEDEARTKRLGQFLIPGETIKVMPESGQLAVRGKPDGESPFQLVRFITGIPGVVNPQRQGKTNTTFTQATLRLDGAFGSAEDWRVEEVKVLDLKSKKSSHRTFSTGYGDKTVVVNIAGTLDPMEGPCTLGIQFVRKSHFAPEELAVIKGVSYPATEETDCPKTEVQLPGRQLIIKAGYGTKSSTDTMRFNPLAVVIEAALSPANEDDRMMLLEVRNEAGEAMSTAGVNRKPDGKYLFGLQPNQHAKSMDLKIAVSKSRVIHFEATPVLYSTNAVTGK